jgi:uncharacterized protein with NRDE domain
MCTFIILRRPGTHWPVLIAANRDEMIDRPWLPPARHWPDRPEVIAGRDVLAGGSWLGLNDHGVVAGILNRHGSLGPAPNQRSRGELVLEALDHADAAAAAQALAAIEPSAYRTFNLMIADNRDAYWLRHADPSGTLPITVTKLKPGLGIIASGDLNDMDLLRLERYRPLFEAATPPDPDHDDWAVWEKLLTDGDIAPGEDAHSVMRFDTGRGFATVSSTLIALPAPDHAENKPRYRFAAHQPSREPWRDVLV